jgi:hypothetical protein
MSNKKSVKKERVVRNIGTKASVYKGFAKKTSGGLTKKDIVRVTRKGVVSYKSKKRVKASKSKKSGGGLKKWRDSLQMARKELIKEGKIKDTKSFSSFAPKKGTALYRRTREIYDA